VITQLKPISHEVDLNNSNYGEKSPRRHNKMRGLTKPTMRMSQLSKLSQNRALASISISAQWRCLHTSPSRKSIGASSSSSSKIVDIEAIRTEMLARPPQIHPDIMSPTNSSLLFNTLSDSIPAGKWQRERLTSGLKKEETGSAPPMLLPPGHHLVYFPLARPNSKLCPDGTDPYHTPHNTPFTRRMWAGGSISGFQRSRLFLDCRKALCHERIVDVNVRGSPGSEKIFVEVLREYVAEDEFDALYDSEAKMLRPRTEDSGVEEGSRLTERRTLVFMRELSDEDRKANLAQAQRVVKCKYLSLSLPTAYPSIFRNSPSFENPFYLSISSSFLSLTYLYHQLSVFPAPFRSPP